MDQLLNIIKTGAGGLDGLMGQVRFGLVSSFDPNSFSAKVLIQPENVLSGWLPVLSSWVGNGWGFVAPIPPGTQVVLLALEGDAEQAIIAGAVWSLVDKPPVVPVGEAWLYHQSGSVLKVCNDGTIQMNAKTVNITGNLVVSGDISDQDGGYGPLSKLRNTYNLHEHNTPDGMTSKPLETV